MGADLGEAGPDGPPELLVRLAPGTYDLGGLTLAHRVSLQGAGRSASTVRGTVHGLRTGATLAGVTVTGGVESGIRIPAGEAPSVVSATIEGNRATDGGGLLIGTDAAPLVARCRIARNWAWEHGGGVDCRGPAALVRCEISENFSPQGGGIASSAADTVSACRIAGNQAASGGGLWLRGSSRVSGCVISGNLAGQGGGLAVVPGAAPVVVGCEISGNCAIATSAVYLSSDATVEVRSSTIAGNEGAGIWCVARAVATLESSIVWGNLWGPIARDDATVRVSYSCLEGPESASGPGNVALDPRFARPGAFDFSRFVVAEIGGIEQEMPDFVVEEPDYRLLDDSPCLDSGRPRGAGTDLDGNRRPCGAGLDMGAYERGDCRPGPRFVRGDANADGRRDLSDAVSIAHVALPRRGRAPVPRRRGRRRPGRRVHHGSGAPPEPPVPVGGIAARARGGVRHGSHRGRPGVRVVPALRMRLCAARPGTEPGSRTDDRAPAVRLDRGPPHSRGGRDLGALLPDLPAPVEILLLELWAVLRRDICAAAGGCSSAGQARSVDGTKERGIAWCGLQTVAYTCIRLEPGFSRPHRPSAGHRTLGISQT